MNSQSNNTEYSTAGMEDRSAEEEIVSDQQVLDFYYAEDIYAEDIYTNPREEAHNRMVQAEVDREVWVRELERWCEENHQSRAPLPTEAEIAETLEREYLPLLEADAAERQAAEKQRQDRRMTLVCQWYDDREATTAIKPGMPLPEMWAIYIQEIRAEEQARVKAQREAAHSEAKRRDKVNKKLAHKKGKARAIAKRTRPNAHGNLQGQKARDAERQAKAEQKENKINGKESTYMGKRAKRAQAKTKHDQEKRIVTRPIFTEPPKIEEEEPELQEGEEAPEPEPEEPTPILMAVSANFLPPKRQAPKPKEEETDEDFARAMLKARGMPVPKPKDAEVWEEAKPKRRRSKPTQTKPLVGFQQSLIAQKKEKRRASNPTYDQRQRAYELLADKKELDKTLVRTRMCRSVIAKTKCPHGKRCRFAHNLKELTKKKCYFGTGCRYVISQKGVYQNRPGSRTGKVCDCWHPEETERNYCQRLNIPYTVKPVAPKTEPVRLSLKSQPKKPAPVAPWVVKPQTKPSTPVQTPRKSRWGPPPPSTPVQTPRKSRWGPSPNAPVKKSPRRSRWEATKPTSPAPSTETVIRCSLANLEATLKMVAGRPGFKVIVE